MTDDLISQRNAVLMEHIAAENDEDVDRVIATFTHPRYEIVPTGEIFDGESGVRRYYAQKAATRPSNRYEVVKMHHCDTAVIVEIRTLSREPAPPHKIDFRSIAVFEFDGPHLMCERVYYDMQTYERQIAGLPQV
ncbi:nuclear transport factor 2 family protein [Phytohabitans suffuscus]|uniref:SnoaL-like domain-containing protein n=1 Tax=Phytohabitans suffuscus TaxID=624315 RepID=A0A6F8YRM3_9ACTN|nr:nuclear transport factor 2 family protein [Phytohabitans suffuscus]BCB88578.1 hypothetical protein Psuf_058910 [Phytohabitans suffuscus]